MGTIVASCSQDPRAHQNVSAIAVEAGCLSPCDHRRVDAYRPNDDSQVADPQGSALEELNSTDGDDIYMLSIECQWVLVSKSPLDS